MKFVKLLTAAYAGGALRHPHEGAIPVEDAEAERLVKEKVAEDVTEGFSAAQIKAATAESITVDTGDVPSAETANPHQAEVAPAPTPKARKASADKE